MRGCGSGRPEGTVSTPRIPAPNSPSWSRKRFHTHGAVVGEGTGDGLALLGQVGPTGLTRGGIVEVRAIE